MPAFVSSDGCVVWGVMLRVESGVVIPSSCTFSSGSLPTLILTLIWDLTLFSWTFSIARMVLLVITFTIANFRVVTIHISLTHDLTVTRTWCKAPPVMFPVLIIREYIYRAETSLVLTHFPRRWPRSDLDPGVGSISSCPCTHPALFPLQSSHKLCHCPLVHCIHNTIRDRDSRGAAEIKVSPPSLPNTNKMIIINLIIGKQLCLNKICTICCLSLNTLWKSRF